MHGHGTRTDIDVQREQIVIRPNRSLSPGGILFILALFAALLAAIATAFSYLGAWMVLPFAGAELVVVAGLCSWMFRHRGDCEIVAFDDDQVRVIRRTGATEQRYEFQRYWTNLRLESGPVEWYPLRLWLGSHGRYVEIGAGVTDEVKRGLVDAIRARLRGPPTG